MDPEREEIELRSKEVSEVSIMFLMEVPKKIFMECICSTSLESRVQFLEKKILKME